MYEAQHLELEVLGGETVADVKARADMMVQLNGACAVVTDVSCDSSCIFSGELGRLMGLTDAPTLRREVDSSDEDEIYNRIHPEDLVEKRILEYEFFKRVDAMPAESKMSYRAACRIRMMDRDGVYRLFDNSTQVVALSPAGRMWLILCCYGLSGEPVGAERGIAPCIISNHTGEMESLLLGERRSRILTVREKQVLGLIQQGRLSKQIAVELGISVHTVNRHRQNIIEKLSVGNSIEAIMAAKAMKLL